MEEIFLKNKPSQVLSQDLAHKDYLVNGLTDTAVVYFLPRFLFLILTNAEALDVFVESVVSRLTPPKGDGSRREKWNHSIESILSIQKIRLVAKTFDWLSSVNEFDGYKKAIDEYWGRYLNT